MIIKIGVLAIIIGIIFMLLSLIPFKNKKDNKKIYKLLRLFKYGISIIVVGFLISIFGAISNYRNNESTIEKYENQINYYKVNNNAITAQLQLIAQKNKINKSELKNNINELIKNQDNLNKAQSKLSQFKNK